jgi:hypothetical protein
MARWTVGAVIVGWLLACSGTETAEPAPDPAPDRHEEGEARERKGGKGGKAGKGAKAEERSLPAFFTGLEQGDLLHLNVDLESGEGMSFVCVDAACEAASGWATGTPVRITYERRPVRINDSMTEEMDVVVSVVRVE